MINDLKLHNSHDTEWTKGEMLLVSSLIIPVLFMIQKVPNTIKIMPGYWAQVHLVRLSDVAPKYDATVLCND